jgi:hypothetical protein
VASIKRIPVIMLENGNSKMVAAVVVVDVEEEMVVDNEMIDNKAIIYCDQLLSINLNQRIYDKL